MTDERVDQFTSGQAIGVDVASIERELASLWRQSAATNAERDVAVTRACQWNLVMHAPTDAEHDKAKAYADAIVAAVPSRTIIVRTMPNATGTEIEAFVTANCQVAPGGGKLLCSEEITIEARGRGLDHVASLLRALQVPDIPTATIFCGAPPSDAAAMRGLLGGTDRVIVDSANARGSGGLAKLAHVADVVEGGLLADLDWLRLAPMRYVLAGVFDEPMGAQPLFALKRVRIECTMRGIPGALLLLGWLASRLSWGAPERLADRDVYPTATRPSPGAGWNVPRHAGSVRVDVELVDKSDRKSGVRGIFLESETGLKVQVKEAQHGALEVQCPGLAPRVVAADEHNDHELLVAALGTRGRDKLYATALHRAVELER